MPDKVYGFDRQTLTMQLLKLRQRNGLADVARLADQAPLLLEVTRTILQAEGSSSEETPRCLRLITDALKGLPQFSAALLEYGLNTEGLESSLEGRLQAYAKKFYFEDLNKVKSRERSLYPALADFVLEEVTLVKARAAHRSMLDGEGDKAAAALFVVNQFAYYFRIFSPVYAIGADLSAFINRRWRDPSDKEVGLYKRLVLWRLASYEVAVVDFVHEQGGNWIASSADAESMLVNELYNSRLLLPVSDEDSSFLRRAFRSGAGEFVDFELSLGSAVRRKLTAQLDSWLAACTCNPRRPRKACEVHRSISHSTNFATTVEREWYRLSSWYQLPTESVSAEIRNAHDYYLNAEQNAYRLERS